MLSITPCVHIVGAFNESCTRTISLEGCHAAVKHHERSKAVRTGVEPVPYRVTTGRAAIKHHLTIGSVSESCTHELPGESRMKDTVTFYNAMAEGRRIERPTFTSPSGSNRVPDHSGVPSVLNMV